MLLYTNGKFTMGTVAIITFKVSFPAGPYCQLLSSMSILGYAADLGVSVVWFINSSSIK